MENTYGNKQPFTEQLPSANRAPMKPQDVDAPFKNLNPELKNPFVIPGIQKFKNRISTECQIIVLIISLKEILID